MSEFIGAVTPEPLYLDKGLRALPTQIDIDSDDKNEGLKKLIVKIINLTPKSLLT